MTELEKHLRAGLPELEKQFRAEMMLKIDNAVCELESSGDFSRLKYPEVSIDNFKRVALQYLDQAIDSRDWFVNFDEKLLAIAMCFAEREIELKKKHSTELLNVVNKNPSDELYCWVIEEQFNAGSYLESNTNPVVEHWESKLGTLKVNLKDRREVVGTFNKKKDPEIKVRKIKDNTDKKAKAETWLSVLSGNWLNGEKIMTDDEYQKVIEGVYYLIDNDEVKPISKKINDNSTMQFIRRLFRELNTDLFGRPIKGCFIDFLHAYFESFKNTEPATTKKHFKEYRNGTFKTDYQKVKESISK